MSLSIVLAIALAATVAGSAIHADLSPEAVDQQVVADHKRLYVLSESPYNHFLVFSMSLTGGDQRFETDLPDVRASFWFNPIIDVLKSGVPQILFSNVSTQAPSTTGTVTSLNLLPIGSTVPQQIYVSPPSSSSFNYRINQVTIKDGQAWFALSLASSASERATSDSIVYAVTLDDSAIKTQLYIPHGFVFPGSLVFDVDTEKEIVVAGGCLESQNTFSCYSSGTIFFSGYGTNKDFASYLVQLPDSQATSLAFVDDHVYFTAHKPGNTSLYSIAYGQIKPKLLLTYDRSFNLARSQMRVDKHTLFVNGNHQIFAFEVNNGELVSNSTLFSTTAILSSLTIA